jgi:hypothetical protein
VRHRLGAWRQICQRLRQLRALNSRFFENGIERRKLRRTPLNAIMTNTAGDHGNGRGGGGGGGVGCINSRDPRPRHVALTQHHFLFCQFLFSDIFADANKHFEEHTSKQCIQPYADGCSAYILHGCEAEMYFLCIRQWIRVGMHDYGQCMS